MKTVVADQPWKDLPPEVARVLRPELPALADEIIAALSEGVLDYRRPLEGPFGRGLRVGVQEALSQFMVIIEGGGDASPAGARELYVNLGRGEMLAGRTLDALLAAYRLGARVAWRRLAAAGAAGGLSPDTLYLLAESIFVYIDELSAESVEGYAQEQSVAAGESQRRRRDLVRLLVQDPPADPTAIAAAATEVRWELPNALAALALDGEDPDRLAGRLGVGTIAAPVSGLSCALVPDPDAPGRRADLERRLAGLQAVLGPTVAWTEAAESFRRAAAAARLLGDGVLTGPTLIAASDHAVALLVHSERALVADLAAKRLAPLSGLPAGARTRLSDTLRAWLDHQGRIAPIAQVLHVHPQTVRYRLGRLRELFGEALDDPEVRFELELALRASRP